MTPRTSDRPPAITYLVVLAILVGLVEVGAGLAVLVAPSLGDTSPQRRWLGIFWVAVGVLSVAVGLLLRRGSTVARMVLTVLTFARLSAAVVLLAGGSAGRSLAGSLFYLLSGAVVLVMLWNRDARDFFARASRRL